MPNQIKICKSCNREFKSEADFLVNTNQWRLCSEENLYLNCKCGSTLMLPKGKYSWYDPQRLMRSEGRSLFSDMKTKVKLPLLDGKVLEMMEELQQDNPNLATIAKIIKKNVLQAARILELANQRSAGLGIDEIKKIEHAISSLGLNAIKDFLMIYALESMVPQTKVFQSSQFWADNSKRGNVAEKLSQHLGWGSQNDELFMAASLCNIGILVAAFYYPEQLDAAMKTQSTQPQQGSVWKNAEKTSKIPSHLVLGDIAICFWGLPNFLRDYVQFHHSSLDSIRSLESRNKISAVIVANQLANGICYGEHTVDQPLLQEHTQALNLSVEKARELANQIASC